MAAIRFIAPTVLLLGCTGEETASLECSISEVPTSVALSTSSTALIDELGREITLRGVNAGGRSKMPPYAPFDFEEGGYQQALDVYLDRAEAWGLNVLRVPFSWQALEPTQGSDDLDYLSRYDALIDGAWERGMWTIVDFHQDIYAENYCGDGFPGWTLNVETLPEPHFDCSNWFLSYIIDPAVQAAYNDFWADTHGAQTAFKAMWDRMAERYAEHPGVMGFEIINEPHGGTMEDTEWATNVATPFYSEMAARIHDIAPDKLVFFDSTGLDAIRATTQLERPEGDQLVFAPHFYDAAVFAGGSQLSLDYEPALQRWKTLGNDWDIPVLLGEFGIQPDHPQASAYVRNHYESFDKLGLHATYWEYSTSTEIWNYETLSITDEGGEEYSEIVDEMVRPYAHAVAGRITSALYNAETKTYALSFDATADGVTEIVLPERIFGSSPEISLSGGCFEMGHERLWVRADEAGAIALEVGAAGSAQP
jgi:endoglycosylceramidase